MNNTSAAPKTQAFADLTATGAIDNRKEEVLSFLRKHPGSIKDEVILHFYPSIGLDAVDGNDLAAPVIGTLSDLVKSGDAIGKKKERKRPKTGRWATTYYALADGETPVPLPSNNDILREQLEEAHEEIVALKAQLKDAQAPLCGSCKITICDGCKRARGYR